MDCGGLLLRQKGQGEITDESENRRTSAMVSIAPATLLPSQLLIALALAREASFVGEFWVDSRSTVKKQQV